MLPLITVPHVWWMNELVIHSHHTMPAFLLPLMLPIFKTKQKRTQFIQSDPVKVVWWRGTWLCVCVRHSRALPRSLVLRCLSVSPFCFPCSHCEPCSERRKRLYVQDPLTCKCSCKFTQLQCKSRQLELNERTCRFVYELSRRATRNFSSQALSLCMLLALVAFSLLDVHV